MKKLLFFLAMAFFTLSSSIFAADKKQKKEVVTDKYISTYTPQQIASAHYYLDTNLTLTRATEQDGSTVVDSNGNMIAQSGYDTLKVIIPNDVAGKKIGSDFSYVISITFTGDDSSFLKFKCNDKNEYELYAPENSVIYEGKIYKVDKKPKLCYIIQNVDTSTTTVNTVGGAW